MAMRGLGVVVSLGLVLGGRGVAAQAFNGENNLVNGGCVTDFDPLAGVDYFPEKITVDNSLRFTVEYANSYKIARTDSETIVMVQCGTPAPNVTAEEGNKVVYITVPVTRVAIGATTMLPWIEQLEERNSVVGHANNPDGYYSPCFRERLDDGLVADVYNASAFGADYDALEDLDVDVHFTSFSGSSDVSVGVTEWRENTILAQGEWIEFISLFYNKEALGKELLDHMVDTFECNARRAAALGLRPKPVVVWVEYKTFESAWEIGPCPNYFCEVSELAGGEYLAPRNLGTVSPSFGSVNYYTDDAFVDELEFVDYIIFKGASSFFTRGWEDLYGPANTTDKTDVLNRIPAVREERVFDVTRIGTNAWFEERVSEPDVLLEDMMAVLNPEVLSTVHERVWLRDVFNELPMPETTCSGDLRPLRGDDCVEPPESTTDGGDYETRVLLIIILPLAVAAIVIGLVVFLKPWQYCTRGSSDHEMVKTHETPPTVDVETAEEQKAAATSDD